MTAAAALWFRERKVDAAVFEVGLGGRLDATRLVEAAVCVVTGVALDHAEHLGRTRRGILGEKLGIDGRFTHISTGGGACIEFLTGKTLPAVAVLERSKQQFE